MRKIDTKEILFWFIGIIAMFLMLTFSLNSYGQYPASPSEIGLQGAGVSYSSLTAVPNAGRVVLSSGVYENIDWQDGNLVISGSDIVIRKCRLLWSGDGFHAIRCDNPNANLVIEDCEIDGQGNCSVNGIAYTGYSLIRTWVHDLGGDGLKANGNVTVYRSWIGPLNPLGSDPHCDVVQTLKNLGGPIIFSCSVLEGHLEPDNPFYEEWNGNTNVNCLRFSDEQGPAGDVIIVGNHFMGSGFPLALDSDLECTYKVENNMFDTDFNHDYYYPSSTPVNIIWSNNDNSDGGQVPLINTGENTASYGTVPTISYPYYDGQPDSTSPALSSIADQNLDEGATLNINVSATDNDGDAITLTAPSKPSFATFTDNGNGSGTITLSPQTGDEGTYSITIQASATDGNDQETFSITVNAVSIPTNGAYYCDPVNGSMSNSGTLSSPWGSLEDVFADGKTFAAGDIIYLMSGEHGAPNITASNTSDVTITKYGSDSPVLECIKFNGASHWLVSDIKINPEIPFPNPNVPNNHPVYPLFANSMIQVTGASDITIENCTAFSYNNSSSWSVDDWRYKAWNGVFIQNGSDNITVTDCYFKNVNFGYKATTNCSNLTIENSTIENFAGDGIRPDCDYTVVQYNTVMNCYDINGNHDDLLQVYSSNNVTGIVIRGNTFIDHVDPNQPHLYDGDGKRAQGIALFDGLYIDFVVENNLVVTDHWHGLAMYGAVNCKIVNNTVLDLNNTTPGPAWIKLTDSYDGTACTGNLVRNNLSVKMEMSSNVGTVDNNMVITWAEYSTYFNDYANFDYTLKSNSPAIDAGSSVEAPATDMLGVARPQGSAVDIGCYEYTTTTTTVPVESVTVSPQNLSLETGDPYALSATVYPLSATNKNVDWTSSAPDIADVDVNGVVSALSDGQAIITVTTTDGGFTAQCNVSVSPSGTTPRNVSLNKPVAASAENLPDDPVTKLVDGDPIDGNRWSASGFPQWAEIDLQDVYDLTTIDLVTYQNRDYQYIVETSIDGNNYTTIVDRSSNTEGDNLIDAVSATARYVKITVSGAYTYTGTWVSLNELTVMGVSAPTIIEPTSISIAPTTLDLDAGETAQITETVLPADATDKTIIWSTDNNAIATVDANGVVSAVSSGNATITATTVNGLAASCAVSVSQPPTSITVDPTVLNLIVGGTGQLTETVLPADADDKSVSWTSDNTAIATVDANGVVSGLSVGQTIITATTNTGGLTAQCSVTIAQPATGYIIDEDFSSGASDFTVVAGGAWAVSGDKYVLSNPASGADGLLGNMSVHNTIITGDFELSTLLNITGTTSTWNDAAVVFDFQDANNYCYVSLNESNDGNTKGILKVANGIPTELADITTTILDNTDYILEISKTGNDIVVTLDGNQIASATDATFSGGKVGYGSKNDGAQFDNLLVAGGDVIIEPESITLDQLSITIEAGQSAQINATVLPEEAEDKSVTWSTDNPSVATVSSGLVSAISAGNATITATTVNGLTANCSVTVNAPQPIEIVEGCGNGTASDISAYNDWDNPGLTFSEIEESGDCVAEVVTGGLSGSCIHLKGVGSTNSNGIFIMEGINTLQISDPVLEFAVKIDNNYSKDNLFAYYNVDGGTWTEIDIVDANMPDPDIWKVMTPSVDLPQTANLGVKFAFDYVKNVWIDDITIKDDPNKKAVKHVTYTSTNNQSINIYPNPVSQGIVTISLENFNNNTNIIVDIFDITGVKVYSSQINSQQISIPLNNLSKGIYFVKVSNGSTIKLEKLIVE